MKRTKIICEIYGAEISKSNIARHLKAHEKYEEYSICSYSSKAKQIICND